MKIQLERNLSFGSGLLRCCTVCERVYGEERLRTLLCLDSGTIVGDICKTCRHQQLDTIQQKLHQRACRLLAQPEPTQQQLPSPQKQALILSELAHQPLTTPPFYVWWWKRLTLLATATQELERVRIGKVNPRSRLTRSIDADYSTEEPTFGKDS